MKLNLPTPSGKHSVGTSFVEIVDAGRAKHLKSDASGRRISIKIWYPANASGISGYERERLWVQLDTEANMPGIMKFLLRKARRMQTYSYPGSPCDISSGVTRVLIYNHGLISFASENTSLMEELASLGYVVVSLQHKDQLAEFQALQKEQPKHVKIEQARLQKQMEQAPVEARPELAKRYFEIASNTNNIVAARAQDTAYVATSLWSILSSIPGFKDHASLELVGVLGLSLGGAVATEYERMHGPVPCVINMDGGIYGKQLGQPIGSNYLMLYSEPNSGSNSLCLSSGKSNIKIETRTILNTKHLNFHDIAALYPSLRWLKLVGTADPGKVLLERNRLVSEFVTNATS